MLAKFYTTKLIQEIKIAILKKVDYIVIFAFSLHTFSWFKDALLVVGGDLIPPTNPMYILQNLWTWDIINCGLPNVILPRLFYLIYLVPMIFMQIGFKIFTAQRFYVVAMYFLSGSSMYFLVSQMETKPRLNKRVIALFSALFYMFNPYLLSSGIHSSILRLPTYGIIPLILALCVKGLRVGNLSYAIFIGILSPIFFSTLPNYASVLLLSLLLICYAINHVIVERDISKTVIFLFTILGVSIFVNLWWLFPFLGNVDIFLSTLESLRVTSKAQWATLTEVVRLLGYWGFYSSYRGLPYYPYASAYVSNSLLAALTYITCLLMPLSAIFIDRKDRSVRFFTVLALTSLFFAKGENFPFGELYSWLLANVPFLRVLREPYRFLGITVIAYSYLIGFTCASIYHFLQKDHVVTIQLKSKFSVPTGKIFQYAISLIMVSLILISSWPLVTGDVVVNWYDSPRHGVKIPSEYYEAEEWLKGQREHFRIFILPQRGTYVAYEWGYQGGDILGHLFSKPLISNVGTQYVQSYSSEMIAEVYNSFYGNETSFIGKVLGTLGVKYILVETSIDTEFYRLPPIQHNIDLLVSQVGIKLVRQFGTLLVYENEFFLPLVYTPISVTFVNSSIESPAEIGWRDDDFRTGWEAKHLNFSTDGDISYITLASEGSYNSSAIVKTISINPSEYTYLLIRFKSNQYTSLCVAVKTTQGTVYLYSTNPTREHLSNNYKSTDWYTLAFNIEESINHPVTSIYIFITNAQNKAHIGKLELWLDYVLFAKSIGTIDETVKEIQSGSTDAIVLLKQSPNKDWIQRTFYEVYNFSSPPELFFQRIDPTKYVLHVTNSTPFLLLFSTSYDSQWKAYIEGMVVNRHIVVNGYANGWLISKNGDYDVIIKYEPQRWFYYGSVISITSLIGSLVYIIRDWKRKHYHGSIVEKTIFHFRNTIQRSEAHAR